jgi:hypothetical protein
VHILQYHSRGAHERISDEREELDLIYQPFFETEESIAPGRQYTSSELERLLRRELKALRTEESGGAIPWWGPKGMIWCSGSMLTT